MFVPTGGHDGDMRLLSSMGEAKRRRDQGLPPKQKKMENKTEKSNSLNAVFKGPRLGLYLGAAFVIYLIYDIIHYYTRG